MASVAAAAGLPQAPRPRPSYVPHARKQAPRRRVTAPPPARPQRAFTSSPGGRAAGAGDEGWDPGPRWLEAFDRAAAASELLVRRRRASAQSDRVRADEYISELMANAAARRRRSASGDRPAQPGSPAHSTEAAAGSEAGSEAPPPWRPDLRRPAKPDPVGPVAATSGPFPESDGGGGGRISGAAAGGAGPLVEAIDSESGSDSEVVWIEPAPAVRRPASAVPVPPLGTPRGWARLITGGRLPLYQSR
jgi:hypothetical protein